MTPNAKRKNREKNTPEMERAIADLGLTVNEYHLHSYRISKKGYIALDYFPGTNKCFFHEEQEWGEVTEIYKFLQYQFTER